MEGERPARPDLTTVYSSCLRAAKCHARTSRTLCQLRHYSVHDLANEAFAEILGHRLARYDPALQDLSKWAYYQAWFAVVCFFRRDAFYGRNEQARRIAAGLPQQPASIHRTAKVGRSEILHATGAIRDRMPTFADLIPDPAPDPAGTLSDRDLAGRLLAVLPPRERELVELYYLLGLNMRHEVCPRMGITESAAWWLRSRAVARLREAADELITPEWDLHDSPARTDDRPDGLPRRPRRRGPRAAAARRPRRVRRQG